MNRIFTLSLFLLSFLILPGCTSISMPIDDPTPSTNLYANVLDSSSETLTVNDGRLEADEGFSVGLLDVTFVQSEEEFEIIKFLEKEVINEMTARGININSSSQGDILVEVTSATMLNHRSNGFSPYVTLTTLSADIQSNNETHRAGIFIRRAKVPVWSFNEVIEPTVNQPLDLLVKELAAKINYFIYHNSISNQQVESLVNKINSGLEEKLTYLDVYQLGFGNNPSAIPYLVDYSKSDKEYIRSAAISSLGTLHAIDQFDYLKSIAESGSSWVDRGMALKSIGDLNTADSKTYLMEVKELNEGKSSKKAKWELSILNLYLN